MSSIEIRAERASDMESILVLLRDAELPLEDLVPGGSTQFLVADDGGVVAGCIGAEIAGGHALLRSLAVNTAYRGAGIGGRLLQAAESLCRQQGATDAFLLTLTAEPFLARRGYRRLERTDAPDDIAATTEFASICPVSSAFMTKRL